MDNNNILQKLEGLESRYEEVSTSLPTETIADQPRYVKPTKGMGRPGRHHDARSDTSTV